MPFVGSMWATQETDPHWGNVILLMNGQSTVTTDSSSFNHSLVAGGGAPALALDSGQTLFGYPTYKVDQFGPGRIDSGTDWPWTQLGDSTFEWCCEFHARVGGDSSSALIGNLAYVAYGWTAANGFSGSSANIGGSSYTLTQNEAGVTGEWAHVAYVRDNSGASSYLKLYVDGVLKATSTSFLKSAAMANAGGSGQWILGWATIPVYGHFSNIRVTKNTARYYADFTPPSAAYPTS